ncbi:AEC family transporter [Burkholderia sp. AU38729]|uniref:AEC family transporter n=1 Tax=Burkholderia sp. AU38729 TaxID=2879633 RepID=UPI001CF317E9|nr:hypothetical protein [Burkholderia sp. AU38729]MCA8061852.1 hypothetical protein [Burkholderia sp. AU38729]
MIGPIVLALAPVALLVAFGHGLRRTGFIGDAFWPQAERLCYYVLLPALFADGLANARLQSLPVLPLAAALVGSTALAAALLLLVRRFVRVDGAGFTSVFQGAVRFNNYVGTALAAGLFGAKGIALAAVCVAAIVPTANLMCVLVFARYGDTRLGAAALTVALLFQALPTSSASYIMARQLGGDAPLMAGITAFQTVAAALAMPVVLSALASAPAFR